MELHVWLNVTNANVDPAGETIVLKLTAPTTRCVDALSKALTTDAARALIAELEVACSAADQASEL